MLSVQGIKNSPESAKYLAMAMEMYFTLVDDQDADVRMVADENLNRVTRSLGDSSVGRLQVKYKFSETWLWLMVQVELYKEIKKNGSSRWELKPGQVEYDSMSFNGFHQMCAGSSL